jgi:hypothetical protein
MNLDGDKFSEKDLYQQLWEGRNFELSHFWQRSIFLATIFVILITAYGKIIFSMYFPEKEIELLPESLETQHFIAWGITLLCLAFSMLWIMMSKGSKLWYERYEYSINLLFEKSFLLDNSSENLPRHGNLEYPPNEIYSDSLFSTYAGGYSVSKVNITIGIISMFVFSLLNAFHFASFLKIKFDNLDNYQCALFSIAEIVILWGFLFIFLRFLCKSGESK